MRKILLQGELINHFPVFLSVFVGGSLGPWYPAGPLGPRFWIRRGNPLARFGGIGRGGVHSQPFKDIE